MKIQAILERPLAEVTIGQLGNILQRIAVDDRFEDAGRDTLLGTILAPVRRRAKRNPEVTGHLVRFLVVNDHEDPDRNTERRQMLAPVFRKRKSDGRQ